MIPKAFGVSSNMKYFKVQFWVPYYLKYFLCYMFFMEDNIDIASNADDNIPYSVGKRQCDLETKLQKASVLT